MMCNEKDCLEWDQTSGTRVEVPGTSIQIQMEPLNGKPFAGYIIDKRNGDHLHFPADDIMKLLRWEKEGQ